MDVASGRIRFGPYLVEPALNRLTLGSKAQLIEPGAMDVLVFLLRHAGQVVSAEMLIENVWAGRVVEESSVYKRVSQIRRALLDEAHDPRYIANVPRRGYIAIASVEFLDGAENTVLLNADNLYAAEIKRLAIMPLRDLSVDQQLSWLTGGVTEQLHDQISAWPQFKLLPSALSRKKSVDQLALETDLIVDGFLQGNEDSVTVTLNVIDSGKRSNLWSSVFHGHHGDPYGLQEQISTSVARFFGESIGGISKPSRPEAYAPYLRLLHLRYFGDADENIYWLEKTLDADPDWSWGWADLAINLLTRGSAIRDARLLGRAEAIAQEAPRDSHSEAMFGIVDSWRLAYGKGDLESAEKVAHLLAEKGSSLGYGMLMVSFGLYAEAEAFFRSHAERKPYRSVTWEWLTVARANLHDWHGAMESVQRLVSLFPQESPNTLVCTSWAMRGVDHIEDAQKLLNKMESTLERLRVESIEYGIMCALGFYPLSFEVAMLRGDIETAVRAAEWFEDNEYFSHAGILWLRLNDSRADACFARAPDLRFDRFWWWITRLHITVEIDQHPSILELENCLGYTEQARFELANRASRLSHRSHIQCDPRAYSLRAGDGS